MQRKTEPQHARPHRTPERGTAGYSQSAHAAMHAPKPQPRRVVACRPKSKPNRQHRKPQPQKEGPNHNLYPNTPTQDPSQGWQGYQNPNPSATWTQTQTPHNNRQPSVHSPGTEAACAMQVTRPNEIRRPGVRVHRQACAAFGLEAERATPKQLGTPVPRTCMQAFGTRYARKSREPLGFRPKEGTCASTGAHPPGETSKSRWRQNSPPGVARGRFVWGHKSGLAGCKSSPLFRRGAFSCSSQRQRQREPWGASP